MLGAQKNCIIEIVFEYPQHMLWLRNKKLIFNCALLNVSRGLRILCPRPYMYV